MRIVIQRVSRASVTIEGTVKSAIEKGYLILIGVCEEDTMEDVEWLVRKVVGLRVFDDENGVMNKSIMDVDGNVLVISQFTLFASYKKGNRPSWLRAAKHEISVPLYESFCNKLSVRKTCWYRRIRSVHEGRTHKRRSGDYLYGHEEQGIVDKLTINKNNIFK